MVAGSLVALAGYLRGKPVPMTRGRFVQTPVPASAEILLEGEVPPRQRRQEGPFGDHFGHYSRQEPWPVFEIKSVSRRREAVYPATIVGPPPLEDAMLGDAVQQMHAEAVVNLCRQALDRAGLRIVQNNIAR